MAKTWMQRLLDEGEARGEARGEDKTTLTVLAARFGTVAPALKKRVMALSDPGDLEQAAVLAATCGSIEEFRRALDGLKAKSAGSSS